MRAQHKSHSTRKPPHTPEPSHFAHSVVILHSRTPALAPRLARHNEACTLPRVHRREGSLTRSHTPILHPLSRTKSDPVMRSPIPPRATRPIPLPLPLPALHPQHLPPPLNVLPNTHTISPTTPAHSPTRAPDRPRRDTPRRTLRAAQVHSESTGALADLAALTIESDQMPPMHRRRASESSNFFIQSHRRQPDRHAEPAPRKRTRLLAYSDFALDKTLGSGGTAVVVRAQPKMGSSAAAMIPASEVALKVVARKGMNRRARHYLEREIFIHHNVQQHPNIVSLYEVFRDSSSVYLVMEFLRGSDLYSALKRERRGLSEKVALTVMAQILDALQYMHSLGYAHRDIKPENIMFVEKPALSDGRIPNVKLVDFGLACARDPKAPEKERHSSEKCGTLRYAAPEIVTETSYIPELCDIWSVGIVLYSIIAHRNPYTGKTEKEVLYHIQNTPLSFEAREWKRVSEDTKSIIRKCLSRKPSNRPNAATALAEVRRILDELSRSPRVPARAAAGSDREGDVSGFSSHVTPERGSSSRRRDTTGNADDGSTPRRNSSDDGQGQPANFLDGLIKAFFSGGSSPDRSRSDNSN